MLLLFLLLLLLLLLEKVVRLEVEEQVSGGIDLAKGGGQMLELRKSFLKKTCCLKKGGCFLGGEGVK